MASGRNDSNSRRTKLCEKHLCALRQEIVEEAFAERYLEGLGAEETTSGVRMN